MLDQRSLLGKPSSKDRIMSALLFAQDSLSGGMKRFFQGPYLEGSLKPRGGVLVNSINRSEAVNVYLQSYTR